MIPELWAAQVVIHHHGLAPLHRVVVVIRIGDTNAVMTRSHGPGERQNKQAAL
jgi:hypothetical protein